MAESVKLGLNLEVIREVDSRLMSYNVEMTEVTGGTFWKAYTKGQVEGKEEFPPLKSMMDMSNIMQVYPPIDLYNEKLRKLAKEFGSVWVRVSGTWATKTYYDFDGTTNGVVPEGYQSILTKEQWIGVLDFCKNINAKLLVSVNNCEGLHKASEPWHPTQAKLLFDSAKEYGVPMGLLLQVNLKNIKLEGYPNEGILEIFVDSEFGWPLEYEIKVFKEGLEYQKEFPKIDYSNFPFEKTFAITYTKDVCHMPLSDYRFSDLFVEVVNEICGFELENVFDCDDAFDFDWYELVANNIKNHPITIGGYADFTQDDPRDGELEGADECLFKLDSASDYNNFCVGDSGIVFVLISMENIVNGHLDKAVVDWDCC